MATVSDGPETAPASPRRGPQSDVELVQYERYIDAQLRKTRWHVKGVELTTALITLLVGSLAYLFLVALVDHWVVKGGLGFAGRLVFLLGFFAGAGAYFAVVLWPLLVRRINPVYAAQAIERSRPSLKNSLINFLLLRTRPGGLPLMVYAAVERQAADGLSQVSVESAVDRSRLLHVGWALLAIVALCAVYTVVSPKNPLRSFGRVVAPWADIAAPTRVRITDVTPGDGRAFHDQFVSVSAEMSGVADGEPVTLFYSTADGQLVDQAVAMSLPPGGLRYTAELPPTSGGLQQDIEYYLTAGDALTRRYGIKVLVTPSIVVERVEYAFPHYTEIDPRVADRQGDLKGIEGTRVTIHAEANDDIKSAYVDLDCDGRSDVTMQVDGRKAKATFTLGLRPKSDEPAHASYQLRFQNTDGEENPRPVRHQIEVIKDLAPRIAFVEPVEAAAGPAPREAAGPDRAANRNVAIQRGSKNLAAKNAADRNPPVKEAGQELAPPVEQQLPQGQSMRMAVEASDPDYKLGSVKLMAQRNGQPLLSKELLAAPLAGPFQGAFFFSTSDLKLAAGDTVIYWAVAEDNKQPEPNRTETQHFTLRITSPEQPPRPQDQLAKADPKQQQPKPNDRRDQNPDNRDPKNQQQQDDQPKQDGQKGEGKPGEGGQDGNDAQRQREQQRRDQQPQADQPAEGQKGEGQKGEDKGGQGKASEQKPDQKNPDENESDHQSDHQKSSDNPSGEGNEGGEGKPGDSKPADGKPGEGKSEGGKSGEKPSNQSSNQEQGGGEAQRPIDPDAQPGDAIQKILDRRNQAQQKESGDKPAPPSPDDPTNRDQNPQQQPGEKDAGSAAGQAPNSQPDGNDAKGNESQRNESKGTEKSPQSGNKSGEPQKPDGDASREQSEGGATDKGSSQSQGAEPKESQPKGGKGSENKAAGEKPMGENTTDDQAAGQQNMPKPGDPTSADPKSGGDPKSGEPHPGDLKPGEPKPGQGEKSGEQQPTEKPQTPPQAGAKPEDKQGGDAESKSNGSPGAGEGGGNQKGSPSQQEEGATPREKKQEPSGAGNPDSEDKPESPSISKKESDSKGGEDGDRAGGGGKGGGQPSKSQGTGSAGQNTAAEQGSGQANTPGDGETGDNGGDKTKGKSSDGAGKSSGKPGDGNQTQPGGSKPGAGDKQGQPKPGEPMTGEKGPQGEGKSPGEKPAEGQKPPQGQMPQDGSPTSGDPSQAQPDKAGNQPRPPNKAGDGNSGNKDPGGAAGNPTGGGGMPPDQVTPPAGKAAPNEEGADDANLEYSRKATDLALEYLKDQMDKENPDKKLLQDLKWTREDAARFVAKWEKMKRDAQAAGPQGEAARKQLDDALEGLGLRPRGTSLRGGQTSETRTPTVRDARRSEPPPEYRQQFRAFTKGVAQGDEGQKPAGNK